MGDQNKSFAPQKVCSQCVGSLSYWANKNSSRKKIFQFDWPMSWREPTCHPDDCYFCSNKKCGKYNKKPSYVTVSSVTPVEGSGARIPPYNIEGNPIF